MKQVAIVRFFYGFRVAPVSVWAALLVAVTGNAAALLTSQTNHISFTYPAGIAEVPPVPWQEWPHLTGAGYAIITTDAIVANSTNLAAFVAQKQRLGFKVTVVTETTASGGGAGYGVLTGPYPDGVAEKIRTWLITNRSARQLRYVLLVGDPDPDDPAVANDPVGDIPMKAIDYPGYSDGLLYNGGTATGRVWAATDLYYADLSGNWDLDGDGYYGEKGPSQQFGGEDDFGPGGVDVVREVYVGRIPVYGSDSAALDTVLARIIEQENNPSGPDLDEWRDRALVVDLNHPAWAETLNREIFEPCGIGSYRQLNTFSPSENRLPGSPYPFAGQAIRWDTWNRGYGAVLMDNHGGPDGISGVLYTRELEHLRTDRPFVACIHGCSAAKPEVQDNLASELLRQRAVGVVAGSRNIGGSPSWTDPGSSFFIGYHFFAYLAHGRSLGEALWDSKLAWSTAHSWRQIVEINLYGDPSYHKGSYRKIELRNTGPDPLAITAITNSQACVEILRLDNLPVTLAAGDTFLLSVRVNRDGPAAREYADTIHVLTDQEQDLGIGISVAVDHRPDLIPYVRFGAGSVDRIEVGSTSSLECVITNSGTAGAGDFAVAVYLGTAPDDIAHRIAVTNFSGLAAAGGLCAVIDHTFTRDDLDYLGAADAFLNLRVDDLDVIHERWEDNNRVSVPLCRTYYVTPAGAGLGNGSSWDNAMDSIQDAIDACSSGDAVLVGDGVYSTGSCVAGGGLIHNRIVITNSVTVLSLNGPESTVIMGSAASSPGDGFGHGPDAVRCAYVGPGCTLSGFTLKDGHTVYEGGSIYNDRTGGGAFLYDGLLEHCIVEDCTARWYGGGVSLRTASSRARNCVIQDNEAVGGGGGCYAVSSGEIENTLLCHNRAYGSKGGGVFGGYASLRHCTVTENRGADGDGGGAYAKNIIDCIVFSNMTDTVGTDADLVVAANGRCETTCTPVFQGQGNIVGPPLFTNAGSRDYRLACGSPCIDNAGIDDPAGPVDLAGGPRVVNGRADMGAYEYPLTTSGIPGAWLRDHGLPTDGTADMLDSDGDGMNNRGEYEADTIPTDADSVLRFLAIGKQGGGTRLNWMGGRDARQFLQTRASLSTSTVTWTTIYTNHPPTPSTNAAIDPGATNCTLFYRIRAER